MATLLVIVTAIMLSVLVYWGTPPMFIAYGVAMTGIGMLTLTGNTISMDVFGPVADNANGIGEMGYDRRRPGEGRAGQLQAGQANPGRPRCRGQHHQGRDQGHRHRLGRDRRRVAVRQLHRRHRRGQRGQAQPHEHRAISLLLRLPHRGRSHGAHRPVDRRRGAVPLQLDADPGRGPGGVLYRQGVPHPVQGSGHHGGHEEAQLRPRRRYLHQHRPERTDRSGNPGHPGARSSSASSWGPTPWAASWPA